MSTAKTTTDHDAIRKWVEERDGQPARVDASGGPGILRIDFAERDEDLEPISWEEFFKIFDESDLAFLHQDKTEDGKTSRFNKFVDRED
jgi:hypothetical protein